jgi:hypothetical protein
VRCCKRCSANRWRVTYRVSEGLQIICSASHIRTATPAFLAVLTGNRNTLIIGWRHNDITKYSPAPQHYSNMHWWILLSTHLSFRWTIPLKGLSYERWWTKSAEISAPHPLTENYRLIPLLAALISLDSPFNIQITIMSISSPGTGNEL